MRDYENFLAYLSGEPHVTLFEPFPNRRLVTQLIWRGGDSLWNTPEHKTDTLVEFYAYIKSDVAIIEPSGSLNTVLAHPLPEKMRYVIISDDPGELAQADKADKVCALATRGEYTPTKKPLICLARTDESPETTLARCKNGAFAAVYLREHAEKYAREARVLGGYGSARLAIDGPTSIYKRVGELAGLGCAIGSGSVGEYCEYLGFISMLGEYNRCIR